MSIEENLTKQSDDASDDAALLALRRTVRRISLGVLEQFKMIALMNQELGCRPGVFYCAICNAESGSPWMDEMCNRCLDTPEGKEWADFLRKSRYDRAYYGDSGHG